MSAVIEKELEEKEPEYGPLYIKKFPMALKKQLEANYGITDGAILACELLLEKSLDSHEQTNQEQYIEELKNKALAAESKTEARDRQNEEYLRIIADDKKLISSLKMKIKKYETLIPKYEPKYIFGMQALHIFLFFIGLWVGMALYYSLNLFNIRI